VNNPHSFQELQALIKEQLLLFCELCHVLRNILRRYVQAPVKQLILMMISSQKSTLRFGGGGGGDRE